MATKQTRSKPAGRKLVKRSRGISSTADTTLKRKQMLDSIDKMPSNTTSSDADCGSTGKERFNTESSQVSDSTADMSLEEAAKVFTELAAADLTPPSTKPSIKPILMYSPLDQFYQIHNMFVSTGCQLKNLQTVLSFHVHGRTVPPELCGALTYPVRVWLGYANVYMYKAVVRHQEEMRAKSKAWHQLKTNGSKVLETDSGPRGLTEPNRNNCKPATDVKLTQPGESQTGTKE